MMEYDIHTVLDLLTLLATLGVLYCMLLSKMRVTYQKEQDLTKAYFVVSVIWCSTAVCTAANCRGNPRIKGAREGRLRLPLVGWRGLGVGDAAHVAPAGVRSQGRLSKGGRGGRPPLPTGLRGRRGAGMRSKGSWQVAAPGSQPAHRETRAGRGRACAGRGG